MNQLTPFFGPPFALQEDGRCDMKTLILKITLSTILLSGLESYAGTSNLDNKAFNELIEESILESKKTHDELVVLIEKIETEKTASEKNTKNNDN